MSRIMPERATFSPGLPRCSCAATRASPLIRLAANGLRLFVIAGGFLFLGPLAKLFLPPSSNVGCVARLRIFQWRYAPGEVPNQSQGSGNLVGIAIAADQPGCWTVSGTRTKPLAGEVFHLQDRCWQGAHRSADLAPRPTTVSTAPAVLVAQGFQPPASHLEAKVGSARHGWHGSGPTITVSLWARASFTQSRPPTVQGSWRRALNRRPVSCRARPVFEHIGAVHAYVDDRPRVSDVLIDVA